MGKLVEGVGTGLAGECLGEVGTRGADMECIVRKIIRVKFSYPVMLLTLGETSEKIN